MGSNDPEPGSRRNAQKPADPPGGASSFCGEVPNVGRVCGTIAADINDRGQILLPAPGTFTKGRGVRIGG
jgi:hypothetical protein